MLSHKILWICAVALGVGVLITLGVVEFAPEPYGHKQPTAQRTDTCSSKMDFGKDNDNTPCLPSTLYLFYEGFEFGEATAPLCLVLFQNTTISCENSTTFESEGITYGLCLDPFIEVDIIKMYENWHLIKPNYTFQIDFLFQYSSNNSDPCYIDNFYKTSQYPITYFPVITGSLKNFSEVNFSEENLFQVGVNSYTIFNLVAKQDTTVSEDLKYTAFLSTASPIYYGVTKQAPTYIQTIVQIFSNTEFTVIEYEQDFTWIDYVGMVLGVIGGVDVIIRCGEFVLGKLEKKSEEEQGYMPVNQEYSARSMNSVIEQTTSE